MASASLWLGLRPLASALRQAMPAASRLHIAIPSASAFLQGQPQSRGYAKARHHPVIWTEDPFYPKPRDLDLQKLAKLPTIPPYPYGPRRVYKQSNLGLYGNARIRFGNRITSEKWGTRVRRTFKPNVQRKRLWSKSLGVFVRCRVTTRVLKTIDRCGGIDEYVLGDKPARIKELGPAGWALRWKVMQTDAVRIRFGREKRRMGLKITQREADLLRSLGEEVADDEIGVNGEPEDQTAAAGEPEEQAIYTEADEGWEGEEEWEEMVAEEDEEGDEVDGRRKDIFLETDGEPEKRVER